MRGSLVRAAAVGLLLGAAWGVLARTWMRLISTEPEFTWAGTLIIIGFSALLGLGTGVADGARQSGRSRAWTLAVVPGLMLFMSPGMILAPCYLLGGLAWRGHGRTARVVGVLAILVSVAAGTATLVGDGSEPTELSVGDVLVFELGYLALALAMAWASARLWRRTRPVPDIATAEERLRAATA